MSAKNTLNSFGYVAKSFHWIVAFLIIGMLVFGYFLEDFPAAAGEIPFNTHKTIGIIILALVVARLWWRWRNVQPAYSSRLPSFYKVMAGLAHYAIYVVILLMPVSGWVMSTASGHIPHFLGWFYFPMPGIPLDGALASTAYQVHSVLAITLIVLLLMHVGAALFHHFILGDNVLRRMLPSKNKE